MSTWLGSLSLVLRRPILLQCGRGFRETKFTSGVG